MRKVTVGLVDYGVGNHTSVRQALLELGFRCRVTANPAILAECDLLLLPGVGAFQPAMRALCACELDGFLTQQARIGQPILGICLGMQLLAQTSAERGYTDGLGLVSGRVSALGADAWHIGWNTISLSRSDDLFAEFDGESFYFNHSFAYEVAIDDEVARAEAERPFAAAVRRGHIAGVQFHPEKSQDAGRRLLRHLILGLRRG